MFLLFKEILQRRASWCITDDKEEAPVLSIQESLDMKADKGTTVELHINKRRTCTL